MVGTKEGGRKRMVNEGERLHALRIILAKKEIAQECFERFPGIPHPS